MPRPLALTPAARTLRRQVRRDLQRGLVTGSRSYQRAMAEAQALYDRAVASAATRNATRRLRDGKSLHRADGTARGIATRFAKAS